MTSAYHVSPWMTGETRIFRNTVQKFIESELLPHHDCWIERGRPNAEVWTKAGKMGLLLPDVSSEYGGGGGTFAHEAVVVEELARHNLHLGFGIQSIVAHYIHA